MWRQVLSQSPLDVPTNPDSVAQTKKYLNGWRALGSLLFGGRSLSGRESNCVYLATTGARFTEVSSATGLDYDSDSRGIATGDWDGDGDIDLWFTNRTAPRVRFLENRFRTKNHFVSLKLTGVKCNRDAIGARVELYVGASKSPIVRSLSAGEGLVSQSSKWLHFGLGKETAISRCVVHWPGGERSEISGVAADARFNVTQGTSIAKRVEAREPAAELDSRPLPIASSTDAARIVLPGRMPIPTFRYLDSKGTTQTVETKPGSPRLITLWATWCQPCLAEFREWAEYQPELEAAGLQVTALNGEHVDSDELQKHWPDVKVVWDRLELPFSVGLLDASNYELLEILERTLTLNHSPLPVPTSFLLDAQGRLAVVYRGSVPVKQLVADAEAMTAEQKDSRDNAVPFPGKWFTSPPPPDLFAVANQLQGLGRTESAYEYLTNYVPAARGSPEEFAWNSFGVRGDRVADVLQKTAKQLASEGFVDPSIELLDKAVTYSPKSWPIHSRLAGLLIQSGDAKRAVAQSRRMQRLRPTHPLPWNNIAWVLATTDDPEVRDAKKAVELAEKINAATKGKEPSALDTLAVAYSAAGRFQDAIKAAERGLAIAQKLGRDDVSARIESRLRLFQSGQAYSPNRH